MATNTSTISFVREQNQTSYDFNELITSQGISFQDFLKHISRNKNFTIQIILSYDSYPTLFTRTENFVRGEEKITDEYDLIAYNGDLNLTFTEESGDQVISSLISVGEIKRVDFTISSDNYDEDDIYEFVTDPEQKTLFAKDKTRSIFSQGSWGDDVPAVQAIIGAIYPVGSIYITTESRNPNEILGLGTWMPIKDAFLWASDGISQNVYTGSGGYIMSSGGTTEATMPYHNHKVLGHYVNSKTLSHNHYPAVRDNTSSYPKAYARNKAGWIGVMPSQNCNEGQATTVQNSGVDQEGYSALAGNDRTLPYVAVGSSYVDYFWGNYTNTISQSHNHWDEERWTTSEGSPDWGNMPPYLPVYMWRRTS